MPPPSQQRAPEAPKMHVVIAPAQPSTPTTKEKTGTKASTSFSAHAFTYPHPRTGKVTQYLLHGRRSPKIDDEQGNGGAEAEAPSRPTSRATFVLLEASRYAPSHGSWFHEGEPGEQGSVISEKGLLLLAEVDPLLVALPALDSARALSQAERNELHRRAAAVGGDGVEGVESPPSSLGRFVDAESAVCGGERGGDDAERRAAASLPMLAALAAASSPSDAAASAPAVDDGGDEACPSPPPSSRSAARAELLRAAGDALASVCDVKEAGGERYFRLCDRRTSAWLRLKARRAAASLAERGGPAFAGLEGEALEAAGGALVSEWLPREWSERMRWQSPSPSPGSVGTASASGAEAATATPRSTWDAAPPPSTGPFTRDPNLAAPADALASEERYRAAGDFAKKQKADAASAARDKARAARADAKALAAKKEASTMKSLAGFFVVRKKD